MGAKDFDLYGVGGYGEGKIGFGSKLGILSVDFMNGVTNPKARMGQSPLAQGAVGYRTIVPRDCVFDQGSVAHGQNLKDIGMRYVDVESRQGKSSKQSTISQEG